MSSRPLPRYFVSRTDSEWSEQGIISTLEPVHAIDSFFLGGRHVVEREWLVTIDAAGFLRALSDEELSELPEVVQQDLAFNEVIGSAASRSMDGVEFYTFHLEALEQPPETPGLNDPVYLYGTLYGPFPAASDESLRGIQGQLTVNRLDLLAGLVNSSKYSFHYQTGAAGSTSRCFNILLPGDREEEINRGKGLVMAYPLMPGEIGLGDPWNEFLVSTLIFDMLAALKEDIEQEKVNHPLRTMTLPVVNRFSFEKDLEANGYVIKGDMAMRQPNVANLLPNILPDVLKHPLPSAVTNAIGKVIKDKFTLPPEGTVDDFITLARETLEKLPGYPPPRAKALQNRVHQASVEARGGASRKQAAPPKPVKTPQGTVATPQPAKKTKKSEWMNDFIVTHRQPEGPPETRLTNLKSVASTVSKQAPQKTTTPTWMNDFQTSPAVPQKAAPQKAAPLKETPQTETPRKDSASKPQPKQSEPKPDWMKDFE
jgi:hypothetical protein